MPDSQINEDSQLNKLADEIGKWLEKEGKEASVLNDKGAHITVGSNRIKFIITYKFHAEDGYYSALGYYVDTNSKLQCRHFYKSRSESAWRVGCGFRSNGPWVKGGEMINPVPSGFGGAIAGGYIFECLLQYELEDFLERFKPCQEFPVRKAFFKSIKRIKEKYREKALKKLVQTRNGPNELQRDYVKSRQVFNKLPGLDIKTRLVINELVNKSQADLQMLAANEARNIKNDPLWRSITPCLEREVNTYDFNHDQLFEWRKSLDDPDKKGKNCKATVFLLGEDIVIEIAQTKNVTNLEFNSKRMDTISISSPICWVKNVYMANSRTAGLEWGEVSSYGNYDKYAQDLGFLAQKPMDYFKQAVPVALAGSIGRIEDADEKKKRICTSFFRFGSHSRPIDKELQEKRPEIVPSIFHRSNVLGEVVGPDEIRATGANVSGGYILLAWYVEKYSPLIQEYKRKNGFELFKEKSRKFQSFKSMEDIFENFFDVRDLTILLREGVVEYLRRRGKRCTQTGRERANDLLEQLGRDSSELTASAIDQILTDLFVRNKVMLPGGGYKKYSDFSSFGLSLGGNIKTDPNSLFTVMVETLLAYPEYKILADKFPALTKNNQVIFLARQHGNENGFLRRLFLEASRLGIKPQPYVGEREPLTSDQSANLLNALRAN